MPTIPKSLKAALARRQFLNHALMSNGAVPVKAAVCFWVNGYTRRQALALKVSGIGFFEGVPVLVSRIHISIGNQFIDETDWITAKDILPPKAKPLNTLLLTRTSRCPFSAHASILNDVPLFWHHRDDQFILSHQLNFRHETESVSISTESDLLSWEQCVNALPDSGGLLEMFDKEAHERRLESRLPAPIITRAIAPHEARFFQMANAAAQLTKHNNESTN